MSGQLWAVVQRHIDEASGPYWVSERQVALAFGIEPATMNTWKRPKQLGVPKPRNLRKLADGTNTPYVEVLWAALTDAGYDMPWPGSGPAPKLPSPR